MVNMVAPCSNLDAEDSRDKGYLFLRVILFRSQKSLQGRRVLSFFSTKKKPASTGDVEGRMIKEPLLGLDRQYSQLVARGAPGNRSMLQS